MTFARVAEVDVRLRGLALGPVGRPAAFVGLEVPVDPTLSDGHAGDSPPGMRAGAEPVLAVVGFPPGSVHPDLARAAAAEVVQVAFGSVFWLLELLRPGRVKACSGLNVRTHGSRLVRLAFYRSPDRAGRDRAGTPQRPRSGRA